MAASANDYFQKVAMSTATTMSAPGYTIGNTTINVGSTTNWPTDTGVTFAVDEVANGEREAGTYNIFRGTVASGTQLANVTYVGGDANRNYSAGATTRVYILVSYAQMNRMIDGLLVSHDQDGTLKDNAVVTANITDSAVTHAKLAAGIPVQMVAASYSAVATGTTTIPNDDTIPQNTEGTEFMSLAITPKSASNILVIEVTGHFAHSAVTATLILGLFQDSTANAIGAISQVLSDTANAPSSVTFKMSFTAGTTSATTFKLRAGSSSAGTTTFNGAAGGRLFGAIPKSSITITEYKV